MPVGTRLTYEDDCLLPNDGKRYEIIEGELFVTPSPQSLHQRAVTRLTRHLSGFVEENHLGEVFVAPFDVVFSRYDIIEPDIQGAPDLLVEVLSPATADVDRTFKLKLYARFAVQEYWILDPAGPSAEIYRRDKPGLELAAKIGPGDSLASPLFPGFGLPLKKLVE